MNTQLKKNILTRNMSSLAPEKFLSSLVFCESVTIMLVGHAFKEP